MTLMKKIQTDIEKAISTQNETARMDLLFGIRESFWRYRHTLTEIAPVEHLETILVVDDNEAVLKMVVTILEKENFLVMSAKNGPEAVKLAEATKQTIDLLLSDADMDVLSGPDLGEILKKDRPDIHVMLMSGSGAGNLIVLNYGWAFIQKPFVPTKLVDMINNVLHTVNRSQLGGQEFDTRKDALERIK